MRTWGVARVPEVTTDPSLGPWSVLTVVEHRPGPMHGPLSWARIGLDPSEVLRRGWPYLYVMAAKCDRALTSHLEGRA